MNAFIYALDVFTAGARRSIGCRSVVRIDQTASREIHNQSQEQCSHLFYLCCPASADFSRCLLPWDTASQEMVAAWNIGGRQDGGFLQVQGTIANSPRFLLPFPPLRCDKLNSAEQLRYSNSIGGSFALGS